MTKKIRITREKMASFCRFRKIVANPTKIGKCFNKNI